MSTIATTYRLSATYYALRPFECEGTLEEIAEIVTASDGEIIHLDDSHYGPGQSWAEPAAGYTGPGWYYKVLNIDGSFTKADSLESAIRHVASADTMTFSLAPVAGKNLYEITLTSEAMDRPEYWDGATFQKANPGDIRMPSKEEAIQQFHAAVAWAKADSADWVNAVFLITLNEAVYDPDSGQYEDDYNEIMSESFTPIWTTEDRRNALMNNDLDWYLVDYSDGRTDLVHATALSSILQCGEPMEQHGISNMQQCWNGEDPGE